MRPVHCLFALCFVAGSWARPDAIALALADAGAVSVPEGKPHPLAWANPVATPYAQPAPASDGNQGGIDIPKIRKPRDYSTTIWPTHPSYSRDFLLDDPNLTNFLSPLIELLKLLDIDVDLDREYVP